MLYCINPDNCQNRKNPDNLQYCQDCGTTLLINNRYRLVQPLRELHLQSCIDVFEVDDQGTAKVLKVLKTDDHKYTELFEQEARLLTNLRHPGIPKAEPDGDFFFPLSQDRKLHCLVMEKIEGENLEQWLQKNQRISQDYLALLWLRQLVEILDYVHHKGFFHRDIKPSNIMLKPNGQLVLIDFGTVRKITQTVIEGRKITAVYSYGYTSQEQAEGRANRQSDFFALGRTFVHLLTGKHPEDLPKISGTDQAIWRDNAPQVSPSLVDFIDELMAPSVQNRPDDTQTILQRIDDLNKSTLPPLGGGTSTLPPLGGGTSTVLAPSPPSRLRWWGVGLTIGGILGVWIAITKIGNLLPTIEPCKSPVAEDVSAIDFSPKGKYIATASLDKTVRVLEVTDFKKLVICQQHTEQHTEGVVAVKFSPDGKYLATASLDSTAGLGEMKADGSISNFNLLHHSSPVVAIDFNPNGKFLATASTDGIVQVWDTKNHKPVALLKDNTYIRAVSFSQDGRYLATVSLDNKVKVWDWNNHSFDQKYMSLPQKNVVAVAFSPKDGKYLATASADGSVQVWDTTSYKEIAHLKDKTYVMAIKFSPDGRYLATVSLDNKVKVWEWEVNRNGQKALSLPQDNVVAVAFSPKDGKYLAMASDDGTAQVWETANGGHVKTVPHGNSFVDIAFSPRDDEYLVTASADGTIKLTKWY
jgi:WD40 repeat protein/tRNA A-37 threonylcarbamoyl transferase component Bud32